MGPFYKRQLKNKKYISISFFYADDGILVNDLLKRKMFRVLRVLFHHDVDPTLLRIYPGDTAIHAAVCIGFQFEHGELFLFPFKTFETQLYLLPAFSLFLIYTICYDI